MCLLLKVSGAVAPTYSSELLLLLSKFTAPTVKAPGIFFFRHEASWFFMVEKSQQGAGHDVIK